MDEALTPDDASGGGGGAPPAPAASHGRTRTWIVVVLVAVAVAIGAATVALVVADGTGIHDGPGTATFTWTAVPADDSANITHPPPQAFTGDIDGHAVSGTATLIVPSSELGSNGTLPTGPIPVYRYRGTFAGSPFDLTLTFRFSALGAAESAPSTTGRTLVTVSGTYGRSAVHGTVTASATTGPTVADPARFAGTVGHWKVTGTFTAPTGTANLQTATAHYVISG